MIPRRHSCNLMSWHSHSVWSFAHLHSVPIRRWRQIAPVYPLGLWFLRHSHFNPLLVYTLYHPSVTFERSRANHDRFADFELVILSTFSLVESRFDTGLRGEYLHPLWCLGQNRAIVSFLHRDAWGLVELLVEKKDKVSVDVLDYASQALKYKKKVT